MCTFTIPPWAVVVIVETVMPGRARASVTNMVMSRPILSGEPFLICSFRFSSFQFYLSTLSMTCKRKFLSEQSINNYPLLPAFPSATFPETSCRCQEWCLMKSPRVCTSMQTMSAVCMTWRNPVETGTMMTGNVSYDFC